MCRWVNTREPSFRCAAFPKFIDTKTRALASLLNQFRKQDRLEAEIKLLANDYDSKTNQENYPILSESRPRGQLFLRQWRQAEKKLSISATSIPVFEEGSVDEDLLMEGNRNLRDYYQRKGYFSAKVGQGVTNRR